MRFFPFPDIRQSYPRLQSGRDFGTINSVKAKDSITVTSSIRSAISRRTSARVDPSCGLEGGRQDPRPSHLMVVVSRRVLIADAKLMSQSLAVAVMRAVPVKVLVRRVVLTLLDRGNGDLQTSFDQAALSSVLCACCIGQPSLSKLKPRLEFRRLGDLEARAQVSSNDCEGSGATFACPSFQTVSDVLGTTNETSACQWHLRNLPIQPRESMSPYGEWIRRVEGLATWRCHLEELKPLKRNLQMKSSGSIVLPEVFWDSIGYPGRV